MGMAKGAAAPRKPGKGGKRKTGGGVGYDPAAKLKKKMKEEEKKKRLRGIKARIMKKMGGPATHMGAKRDEDGAGASKPGTGKKRAKSSGQDKSKQHDERVEAQKRRDMDEKGRRARRAKLLYAKTKRGQPLMKHKIDDMLSKIASP